MTQSPRYRKCTPALWRGLCGMPLALRLNEGLGITGRDMRGVASLAYPHGSRVCSLALAWLALGHSYDRGKAAAGYFYRPCGCDADDRICGDDELADF